jgi:hypothetical protein
MRSWMMLIAIALLVAGVSSAWAADEVDDMPPMPEVLDGNRTAIAEPGEPASANAPVADAEPAPAPAPTSPQPPSAEDVMQQMLQQQQQDETTIAPTSRPGDDQPRRGRPPTAAVRVDTSVLGIAPGGKQPTLRREGEFIVARRGRLIRSPDGAHMLFAFDADDRDSPETPLIILPCQMLQSMEEIVQQRGDRVVFILSGQITAYRGANYVMPTMMKLAIDRAGVQ